MPFTTSLRVGESLQISDVAVVTVVERNMGGRNIVKLVVHSSAPVKKLPIDFPIESLALRQYTLGLDGVPERVAAAPATPTPPSH